MVPITSDQQLQQAFEEAKQAAKRLRLFLSQGSRPQPSPSLAPPLSLLPLPRQPRQPVHTDIKTPSILPRDHRCCVVCEQRVGRCSSLHVRLDSRVVKLLSAVLLCVHLLSPFLSSLVVLCFLVGCLLEQQLPTCQCSGNSPSVTEPNHPTEKDHKGQTDDQCQPDYEGQADDDGQAADESQAADAKAPKSQSDDAVTPPLPQEDDATPNSLLDTVETLRATAQQFSQRLVRSYSDFLQAVEEDVTKEVSKLEDERIQRRLELLAMLEQPSVDETQLIAANSRLEWLAGQVFRHPPN